MSYVSDLTLHQRQNAMGICRAVRARNLAKRAAVIATETALCESGMRVLASANVPESQKYPHDLLGWTFDGLGHDHGSMGMFQQQTGYAWCPANGGRAVTWDATMEQSTMGSPNGWGTPAELMNAQISTSKFLNALMTRPWQAMDNWHAAQAVQGSAFPDGSNYHAQDARAQAIIDELWPLTAPKEDDLMVVVQDTKTGRRYLLIPGQRAYYCSKQGAQEYAALFDQTIKPASHQSLLDWDRRMATGPHGVKPS